jgi:hypothetical protein
MFLLLLWDKQSNPGFNLILNEVCLYVCGFAHMAIFNVTGSIRDSFGILFFTFQMPQKSKECSYVIVMPTKSKFFKLNDEK